MTLLALLQARNEERFLPGWLENVAPSVDGIIALDDGSTDATAEILTAHPKTLEVLSNPPGQPWNERGNQMALIQAGRRHGAGWFLCVDADERLEQAFSARVGDLLRAADADDIHLYSFRLRELWDDRRHYRSDGIWNIGARYRMFRNDPAHRRFDPRPLHRYWIPFELGANVEACGRDSGINLYHLRMIAPSDRAARVARYEALDPNSLYEPRGYRYLIDETGLQREEIPPERDFVPDDDPAILPDEISVVIPVYNGAAYLAEAVESVRRQSRLPRRIILVDDGSTDATPQIAAALCGDGREPPVEYVRQDNAGPAAALNRGASLVEDGFIAFLNADDLWVPDKLEWQLQAVAEGADLAFGHMQHFISPALDAATAAGLHCPPEPMPAFSAVTLLTRLDIFRAIGPFNEKFRIGEFMDWYGRAVDLGFEPAMLPQVVAMRRVHGGNHSLTRDTQQQGYAHVLKSMLDRRRAQRGDS